MDKRIPGAQGVEPDAGTAASAMSVVRKEGEARAAKLLGVDRITLPRLIARLPVRRATLHMVQAKLAEMKA